MTTEEILEIILDINIDFQGQPILVFTTVNKDDSILIQVGMNRPDCDNPNKTSLGKGGKAYVSHHSTEDEIVKKVLGLALAYTVHETREGFYYKTKRVFGPHIHLDALMSVCDQTAKRK